MSEPNEEIYEKTDATISRIVIVFLALVSGLTFGALFLAPEQKIDKSMETYYRERMQQCHARELEHMSKENNIEHDLHRCQSDLMSCAIKLGREP